VRAGFDWRALSSSVLILISFALERQPLRAANVLRYSISLVLE
jgi:hypothetical protein